MPRIGGAAFSRAVYVVDVLCSKITPDNDQSNPLIGVKPSEMSPWPRSVPEWAVAVAAA
jgi:hypothetical protein